MFILVYTCVCFLLVSCMFLIGFAKGYENMQETITKHTKVSKSIKRYEESIKQHRSKGSGAEPEPVWSPKPLVLCFFIVSSYVFHRFLIASAKQSCKVHAHASPCWRTRGNPSYWIRVLLSTKQNIWENTKSRTGEHTCLCFSCVCLLGTSLHKRGARLGACPYI